MEKKILIGFLLTALIIVFIPVYAMGESARQEQALHRQQEEALERGAEIFASLCASCHGSQGQGLIGPPLRGSKQNRENLIKAITRGRETRSVPMPAWGAEDGGPLKKHQIDDLVFFVQNWNEHALGNAVAKHSAAHGQLPEEPVAQGKESFARAGCSFCHGGGGEGTNFAPPLAGRSREQIVKQVRQPRTPLMPAYTQQHLGDADLDRIVTFLLTLKAQQAAVPGAASPPAPSGGESQAITEGGRLFASAGCAGCHGPDGKGTAFAPAATGKSKDEITKQVRTPRGSMPAFPATVLGDSDLDKIIAFLSGLKTAPVAPSPTPTLPATPQLPAPTPLPTATSPQTTADGARLFASLGCGACHGPEGKGTAFAPAVAGKSRDVVTKQVRTPKGSMPPVPVAVLSDADLAKLATYLEGLPK